MQSIDKKTGNKPLPANKQKGKKKCSRCGTEKSLVDFYASASPLYSSDKRVPICKVCIRDLCIDKETNIINEVELNQVLKSIQKPYFKDDLESAYAQFLKENSYVAEDNIKNYGDKILGLYFKNTMLRQNKNLSYDDSEKMGFIHSNSNTTVSEKKKIAKKYSDISSSPLSKKLNSDEEIHTYNIGDFEVTNEIIELFGDGYTPTIYKKMHDKYEKLKLNYSIQTNLHQEALATYVRFKVQEEIATSKGDVVEAQKWYQAAQDAADKAKLTPKQLTQADLQGGINSFSEIFKAVEQAVDIIPILPQFKYRPNDALDFNIWCYINYTRDLQGLPSCDYEDVYKFYDKKKAEYLEQYGDPYGIFDEDTVEKNRENIKKFITLPSDYEDGD